MTDEYLVFLETSAINYLSENFDLDDIQRIKYQIKANRIDAHGIDIIFTTSQYVLFEVINTKTEREREYIIQAMQFALDDYILCSPISIIDTYIKAGYPLVEEWRSLKGSDHLCQVWSDLFFIKEKTFVVDRESLRKTMDRVYNHSKNIRNLYKSNFNLSHNVNDTFYQFYAELIMQIRTHFIKRKSFYKYLQSDKESAMLFNLATYFIISLLLEGNGYEYEQTERFWEERKTDDMKDKIQYLVNQEDLFFRGPIVLMARMALTQLTEKTSNRGLYFDCLHSIYFPYVGKIVTCDDHFQKFSSYIDMPYNDRTLFIDPNERL